MSCQTCGHPAEGKVQPHNLGCSRSLAARAVREHAARLEAVIESTEPVEKREGDERPVVHTDRCEHGECSKPKKPWSGKGAKPKYCADGHK